MKNLLIVICVLCGYVLLNRFLSTPTVVISSNLPTSTVPPVTVDLVPTSFFPSADEVFETVQQWRKKTYNRQYAKLDSVCRFAQIRAKEAYSSWSHEKLHNNERTFSTVCPPSTPCIVGENLAQWYKTAPDILDAWLKSPKHKENLDLPYRYSCIAEYKGTYAHIFADF